MTMIDSILLLLIAGVIGYVVGVKLMDRYYLSKSNFMQKLRKFLNEKD